MLVERLLRLALLGSSWVMYLLLFLSIFSIGYMIERLVFFRKNRGDVDAMTDRLAALLGDDDVDGAEKLLADSKSVEAQVLLGALYWFRGGPKAFTDAVESQLGRKKKELERGMGFLGTLGSNAPFIGLLGTVIGVIEAFHQLGDAQNKAAMGNVMAGIAEALVATGVGLFVAIPAVVAYNVVQTRIGAIETNVAAVTKQLTAILEAKDHEVRAAAHPTEPRRLNGKRRAEDRGAAGGASRTLSGGVGGRAPDDEAFAEAE